MATSPDFADLVPAFRRAFGERLASLILYGSAAKGTSVTGRSDINLLVVLTAVEAAALSAAKKPLARLLQKRRVNPVFWTEAELRDALDVFPLEFGDILAHHRVLSGRDVLAGLAVSPKNLRFELEFECRSKLLALRRALLERSGDADLLRDAYIRAGTSFSYLMAEARRAGLVTDDFTSVWEAWAEVRSGRVRPGKSDAVRRTGDLLRAYEKAVEEIDRSSGT